MFPRVAQYQRATNWGDTASLPAKNAMPRLTQQEIYFWRNTAGKGHPPYTHMRMQSSHIFCIFRGVTFLQPSQHVGETDYPTKNPSLGSVRGVQSATFRVNL